MVENLPEMAKKLMDDIIKELNTTLKDEISENLFMTRSVDEIIWGYEDPFLKYLSLDLSFLPLPKDGSFNLEVYVCLCSFGNFSRYVHVHVHSLHCTCACTCTYIQCNYTCSR